jgi:hypothetical protein
MNAEYPCNMTDDEKETHLSRLYPPYRSTPMESVQQAPENPDLDIQETPDETGEEQVSEDLPDAEAIQAHRKRLEESFSLVDSALAYPRKRRVREIETDEQRFARMLSETLGGSQPQQI